MPDNSSFNPRLRESAPPPNADMNNRTSTKSSRKIVMLVENAYPSDTRVRNEATTLQSAGYSVSVIALRDSREPWFETLDGVCVYRLPPLEIFKKTATSQTGKIGSILVKIKALVGYATEYFYFTGATFIVTAYILVRHGFDAIHAHNPPDTLFLVALPFRILGKKYVFDHHDLSPELYQSRYRTGECLPTRILRVAERCSLRTADIVIATNESYKRIEIARGTDPDRVFVVRNGPSGSRMVCAEPAPRLRGMNKSILVYIGALNPQDGVDYLLRGLAKLRYDLRRTDFYCVIMGKGDSLDDLRALTSALKLGESVELTGFVSDEDLRANLAAADICMDPDPSSPLNDVSTWIKIMEYMAYGKPIVSFDLAETRRSAAEAAVYVPANDEVAFAQAIAALMDDPGRRAQMGDFGRARVEKHLQWSVVGQALLEAYGSLFKEPAVERDTATGRRSKRETDGVAS